MESNNRCQSPLKLHFDFVPTVYAFSYPIECLECAHVALAYVRSVEKCVKRVRISEGVGCGSFWAFPPFSGFKIGGCR
ncbi:hypothetical protein Tco_1267681, partial [Tanacetum coccineum]